MAEVRLLPDGWMLIENHCPICSAATSCQQFCTSELEMFQRLFENEATITRTDHLLVGARRCAYKITAHRV
jgi:predicted ArsR family transcriptional regulator